MLLGIDASRSTGTIQKTGVEKVSDEIIKGVMNYELGIKDKIGFVLYTPKEIDWLPKRSQRVLNWPFKYLWTQLRLAWELLFHPPDKLFVPVHKIPFALFIIPNSLSIYIIIHDIAFKYHPESYSFWQRLYLNFDLKRCLKKCKKIFVPSQKVKDDLLKYIKTGSNKIIVIPHGYSRKCTKSLSAIALAKADKRKQILYIGRIEEKKNISNLIKAFKIFSEKHPDYKLILAGKPGHGFEESVNVSKRQGVKDKVKFIGYVNDERKYELLSESSCLVLVSKEEGFGFPILEGFDFEIPVLASDIPVLHEVGGDACLYVNPNSVQEIAIGLERIVSDENLKKKLVEKGKERLKKFSWEKTVRKILSEIIENENKIHPNPRYNLK